MKNIIRKPQRGEKSVSWTERHKEARNPIKKTATPTWVSKNRKSIIDLAFTRPITSKAASTGDTPAGTIFYLSFLIIP